jgi:hypothetical protein
MPLNTTQAKTDSLLLESASPTHSDEARVWLSKKIIPNPIQILRNTKCENTIRLLIKPASDPIQANEVTAKTPEQINISAYKSDVLSNPPLKAMVLYMVKSASIEHMLATTMVIHCRPIKSLDLVISISLATDVP